MTAIQCVWTGEVFRPLNARQVREADAQHGQGEIVVLDVVKGRSRASHDHFFALVDDLWATLPEDETRFPTSEHLRSWALCKAGYCDVETFVASSRKQAMELASFVQKGNVWITIDGPRVTRLTPHSQKMKAMGGKVFQESKTAVLDVISGLLDVAPDQLARAA